MKRNDLVVGEYYAHNAYRGRAHTLNPYAEKVRLVSLTVAKDDVPRYRGNPDLYVMVESLRGLSFAVSLPSLSPWPEYAEQLAALKKATANSKAAAKNAARDMADLVGMKNLPWWAKGEVYDDGSFATHGDLSVYTLAKLLDLAYQRGMQHGRASKKGA